MKALDPGEAAKLMEHFRPTRMFIPVLLGVLCGLRRGEITALRWGERRPGWRAALDRREHRADPQTHPLQGDEERPFPNGRPPLACSRRTPPSSGAASRRAAEARLAARRRGTRLFAGGRGTGSAQ